MIRFALIVCFIVVCFGCNTKPVPSVSEQTDSIKYINFIVNIANNSTMMDIKYQHLNELGLEEFKYELWTSERKTSDSTLGIEFRTHSWDFTQSFPKTIIYIRKDSFEYAFPFVDEFYYMVLNYDNYHEGPCKDELQDRMSLKHQLKYILSQLKIKSPNDINQFTTVFMTSLLGVKEITKNDIDSLNSYLKTKQYPDDSPCGKVRKQNILNIIDELGKPNVRYFDCFEAYEGFWRFEISEINNRYILNPTFVNYECYYPFYF